MPKRILVPLDRSPEAESVLALVGDTARGSGATVRLLHVAPIPDTVTDGEGRIVAFADQESARLEAEATDYLRNAEVHLGGVAAETGVRFGEPAEEIVQEAAAFGADLIVLTARRRGRLSRLILGGTAEQVCRHADASVVIYRPEAHGSA
jgi:nucleotide-binding universal stress UspA family protein